MSFQAQAPDGIIVSSSSSPWHNGHRTVTQSVEASCGQLQVSCCKLHVSMKSASKQPPCFSRKHVVSKCPFHWNKKYVWMCCFFNTFPKTDNISTFSVPWDWILCCLTLSSILTISLSFCHTFFFFSWRQPLAKNLPVLFQTVKNSLAPPTTDMSRKSNLIWNENIQSGATRCIWPRDPTVLRPPHHLAEFRLTILEACRAFHVLHLCQCGRHHVPCSERLVGESGISQNLKLSLVRRAARTTFRIQHSNLLCALRTWSECMVGPLVLRRLVKCLAWKPKFWPSSYFHSMGGWV